MNKDVERLIQALTRQDKEVVSGAKFILNGLGLMVVTSMVLGAGVSYYFTRKHFEHKVDPQVLNYIKNPSTALETEQTIVRLLDKKRSVELQLSLTNETLNKNEKRLTEIETRYSEIKSKMINEKVIYDEAFKDKVTELEIKHQEDLKRVQNDSYDDGVSTGVIGTIGVQMLLED